MPKQKEGKKNTGSKKSYKFCPSCEGGKRKRINTKTGKIIPCKKCKGQEII